MALPNGEVATTRKKTKNEKRRAKKKASKQLEMEKFSLETAQGVGKKEDKSRDENRGSESDRGELEGVEIEYTKQNVSGLVDSARLDDTTSAEFRSIFDRFSRTGIRGEDEEDAGEGASDVENEEAVKEEDVEVGKEGKNLSKTQSKKQRKLKSRLTVSELKQLVQRPDVVEAHDVTAADPKLLVHLKAYRNTVPVPRHWCHKRKYLQGKRGIEKKPFELPEFIAMTGIAKLRDNVADDGAEGGKKAKQRMRERVQPKMGKIDIDYQVLHDAFFKFQQKPNLTMVGELYYEGKEFEVSMTKKKPGHLSIELRTALGMPDNAPPPWLINMQRYGPPPAFPNLRIPGLNAPIPHGASFGYHAGGWGKPPVDEHGNPLYGDVFGNQDDNPAGPDEEVDRTHWGSVDESEEEEEEEDEEEDLEEYEGGMETPAGTETPMDGVSSTMTRSSGLDTPQDMLDLRKRGQDTPSSELPPQELYKVLGEKKTTIGGALFGADKHYDTTAPPPPPPPPPGRDDGGVEVSIAPEELDEDDLGDEDTMREKYEERVQIQEAARRAEKEDVSDIVDEETRKRKRKLERQREKDARKNQFKF